MKNKLLVIFGISLIAAGPLSLISGIAYTMMLPNIYESTAIAQITFPDNKSEKYTTDALIALTKQKAVLVDNPEIFYPVITELNLQESWGREGEKLPRNIVYKILQNSVEITADKNAVGLIRFSVKRDSPTEPAEIANAICEVYANQNDGVTVAKVARPSIRPVSPNLFRSVLFTLIQAGILVGIGLTLLVLGIRKGNATHPPEVVRQRKN